MEETETITVIGAPNCSKCTTVKRLLEDKGITFMYYSMTDLDESARFNYMNAARDKGQRSMPIVLKNNDVVTLEEVLNED